MDVNDRRMMLWERFGKGATASFKTLRSAEHNVLYLIDMEDPAGEEFLRQCYKVSPNIQRTGNVEETAESEITRLKARGLPAVLILPLKESLILFQILRPPIAAGLAEPLPPRNVRVVILSRGAMVLHEPLPVASSGLN